MKNIIAFPHKLGSTASVISKISGDNLQTTICTHGTSKAIL